MTCKIATEQASQMCKEKTPMQNCDEKITCKFARKAILSNLRGTTKPSQIFVRKSVSSQICNSYCCLANLQGIYFRRKFASVLRVIFICDDDLRGNVVARKTLAISNLQRNCDAIFPCN